MLCLALPLTTACKKTPISAEDPQPAEIGFTAASQAAWVKSGETSTPSFPHDDFGVWGIARQAINSDYILWDDNDLTQVNKQQGSDIYVPITPAYWFRGYVYDFIAVAPYTNSGITSTSVHTATNTMSFTYDMGAKYALRGIADYDPEDHYLFDLMGAASKTPEVGASTSSTQTLVFWHMMSKINIGAEFKDANGQTTTGNLTRVRIENVHSKMIYSIKYATPSNENLNGLVVESNSLPSNQQILTSLNFNDVVSPKVDGKWSVHILPQVISNFVVYIDYDIKEGDNTVYYKDVKYTMTNASPSKYLANGQYNWTFKIKPGQDISFNVTVKPWTSSDIADGDEDDNNDIEII